MYELAVSILNSLKNFPIVEGVAAILVLLVGIRIIMHGQRNSSEPRPSHSGIPDWLLIGPVPEAVAHLRQIETTNAHLLMLQQDTNARLDDIIEILRRAERDEGLVKALLTRLSSESRTRKGYPK